MRPLQSSRCLLFVVTAADESLIDHNCRARRRQKACVC